MTRRIPFLHSRLWESRRAQRWTVQAVFAAGLLLFAVYVIVRARAVELGMDFLDQPAGFALSNEWGVSHNSRDTRLAAYWIGVTNTLRVVVLGIVLATVLGIVAGVARLSGNWLVARVATLYVEVLRNTPLLVQIVFWWVAVFLALPRISEQVSLLDTIYISNRAIAIPWLDPRGLSALWAALLIVSTVVALWVYRRRRTVEESSGQPTRPLGSAVIVWVGLAIATFLLTGLPMTVSTPEIVITGVNIRQYDGGLSITPQFAALLLALSTYTGTFIAEIVRGSIQALPPGQAEAAAALGLNGYQRMTLIILPQALRTMIPPITNQYLNLTKNSSLAIVVGYSELFFVGNVVINNSGHAVPMFIVMIVTYQVMSLTISLGMNALNSRVQLVGR